ncbi:MAG TPA: DUF4383 domain-containing protein [Polyangia bacterium]|jgi:hypothetical protein
MTDGNQSAIWQQRSRWLLQIFAPVLIVTGIAGFVVPSQMALMSGACPYNVFHLIAGAVGVVLASRKSARAATAFNVGFGAIDLYQAVAGVMGFFPAAVFALRPADHVVHVVLGLLLVVVGWRGRPTTG